MRKSWEFVLAGTGTIGTAIFAPHERSLRMANMIASFIVGALVPIRHMDGARAERWVGAVVDALPAFGSRAAAKVRRCSRSRESYCFHHVQAIMLAIDEYAETALGNRQYFLNKPHSIGGKSTTISLVRCQVWWASLGLQKQHYRDIHFRSSIMLMRWLRVRSRK